MDGLVIQFFETNPDRKLAWKAKLEMQYNELLKKLDQKFSNANASTMTSQEKTSTLKKKKPGLPIDYKFPTANVSEEIQDLLKSAQSLKKHHVHELVSILYDDISHIFKK
jgi:hypothetical protein